MSSLKQQNKQKDCVQPYCPLKLAENVVQNTAPVISQLKY